MPALAKPRSRRAYRDLIFDLLPDQGQWTEDQYLALTDHSNRLVEFSDGWLEPLPMPTDRHQALLLFVFAVFQGHIERRGGKVRVASLRLRLRPSKFREPDILALLDAHDPRRQNRFWLGADLVAEIVSDDDPDRDLVIKKREYARAGIPEYWIVNPFDETITVWRLTGKRYVRHGRFRRGRQATSALLPGFVVDVSAVFDAD